MAETQCKCSVSARAQGVSSYRWVIVASNKGDFRRFRRFQKFGSLVVHLRVTRQLHRRSHGDLHFFRSSEAALEGLVDEALRGLAVTVLREQAQDLTDGLVRFIYFLQVIRPLVVLVSIGVRVAYKLDRRELSRLAALRNRRDWR